MAFVGDIDYAPYATIKRGQRRALIDVRERDISIRLDNLWQLLK